MPANSKAALKKAMANHLVSVGIDYTTFEFNNTKIVAYGKARVGLN